MQNIKAKLDAIQLENVTSKMLEHVENDVVARFALETHLFELNENKGSAAVTCFVQRFYNNLAA
jgi:hypothetical protein